MGMRVFASTLCQVKAVLAMQTLLTILGFVAFVACLWGSVLCCIGASSIAAVKSSSRVSAASWLQLQRRKQGDNKLNCLTNTCKLVTEVIVFDQNFNFDPNCHKVKDLRPQILSLVSLYFFPQA